MDWKGFKRVLLAKHSGKPQEMVKLARALGLVEEGLRDLTAAGHNYHLAEGDGPPLPEWPKILFHLHAAPNGRVIWTEREEQDLGDGWFDSLEAAQHDDGKHHSMRGRGGAMRGGLPMRLEDFVPVEARLADKATEWKEARRREPSLKRRSMRNGKTSD